MRWASARKRNWLAATIAGCCLLLVAVLILLQISVWLRRLRPPAQIFYEKAVTELRLGTSKQDVLSTFGKTKVLTCQDVPSWVTISASDQARAASFPDGLEPSDEFLHYAVADANGNNEEWYLQFRDNKLVNFEPASYPSSYKRFRGGMVGLAK